MNPAPSVPAPPAPTGRLAILLASQGFTLPRDPLRTPLLPGRHLGIDVALPGDERRARRTGHRRVERLAVGEAPEGLCELLTAAVDLDPLARPRLADVNAALLPLATARGGGSEAQ